MTEQTDKTILTLTAEIVAAHVGHNRIVPGDLPDLIQRVHQALTGLGQDGVQEAVATDAKPAVSIRASIKPDYIVCLEDGKKLTMLKRYLQTRYGMTPQQYRQKWKLPADYPMVAPNYADRRRELAKAIGLGRKPKAVPAAAPVKRGRKPKAA
ncbi:MucR family transcriptional regulator [Sphingomonas sp. BIUV-7]|uniref:MucR family transcriptional regulator n=1 Tax=Sphingomonas natans TaxID=3063330 RepID=A0ABT8YF06_9SPHN|nr:MucR family transcriptional regulator [Sphingomonas sp. BIUV-7]MDO6416368.1 MucR family transcriptional regulator [Sphingomonas sp. BIUV-7]